MDVFGKFIKQITDDQTDEIEKIIKEKLNEGYGLEELEIKYEQMPIEQCDGYVSSKIKAIVKVKTDDK